MGWLGGRGVDGTVVSPDNEMLMLFGDCRRGWEEDGGVAQVENGRLSRRPEPLIAV